MCVPSPSRLESAACPLPFESGSMVRKLRYQGWFGAVAHHAGGLNAGEVRVSVKEPFLSREDPAECGWAPDLYEDAACTGPHSTNQSASRLSFLAMPRGLRLSDQTVSLCQGIPLRLRDYTGFETVTCGRLV